MKLVKMKRLAEELQTVLDLNPKLKFRGSKKQFKKDILEVSSLLTDDDELSPKSEKLLEILSKKKHCKVKKEDMKEEEKFQKEVRKEQLDGLQYQEALVSAAKNLNKELGIKINILGKSKELEDSILGASSIVKKSDLGIKKSTLRIIAKIKENYLSQKGEKKVKVKDKVKKNLAVGTKVGKDIAKAVVKTKHIGVKRPGLGGRDEFGFRIGSQPGMFAKSLMLKPKTMLEIRHEKWNTTSTTFYEAWKKIVEMGRGQRTPEGVMKIISKKKG